MSHALFDAIKAEKGVAHDAKLSLLLGLSKWQVNRYRHGHDEITAALILKIYDFAGFSIERIRELAADTTTPKAAKVKAPKVVKAAWPRKPAAPKPVKVAAPVVPVMPAPKWVSRVHRCM